MINSDRVDIVNTKFIQRKMFTPGCSIVLQLTTLTCAPLSLSLSHSHTHTHTNQNNDITDIRNLRYAFQLIGFAKGYFESVIKPKGSSSPNKK
jgi:hypothetical protein